MLYTYEATKLDHRMHQEKPVGNYMYVVSNPLFMHYALSNNILLNRNRHLLKTNILDVCTQIFAIFRRAAHKEECS